MIAALYVRVSTTEQADEGFSIAAQIRLLSEYCQREEIKIYNIYADEGISGQKENRPEFQKMLKDAQNKNFDIIIVHKFDRFARKVELSQRVKRQLKSAGVNVISMTEPIEDSPIGFFQEGIMELLSEYYVRNLSLEVKKGHIERAKQGLHSGPVPYGYNQDMTINAEHAYPEVTEARRKKILDEVKSYLDERDFQNDYPEIMDWDGNKDEYYLSGNVDNFFDRYKHWNRREECYTGRFYDQVTSCIRAAFDIAVEPSSGVIGFTAGDIRRIWDGQVPDWVKEFWEDDFNSTPDDDPVWM